MHKSSPRRYSDYCIKHNIPYAVKKFQKSGSFDFPSCYPGCPCTLSTFQCTGRVALKLLYTISSRMSSSTSEMARICPHFLDMIKGVSLSLDELTGQTWMHISTSKTDFGAVCDAIKRLPRSVYCIGNHEHRISRAIDLQPELKEPSL